MSQYPLWPIALVAALSTLMAVASCQPHAHANPIDAQTGAPVCTPVTAYQSFLDVPGVTQKVYQGAVAQKIVAALGSTSKVDAVIIGRREVDDMVIVDAFYDNCFVDATVVHAERVDKAISSAYSRTGA